MIKDVVIVPLETLDIGEASTELIVIHEAIEIIEVGVIGPPGKKGDKGDQGEGGDPAIEIPFSFGDATPLVLATMAADKVIESVTVYIEIPFDGDAPNLLIGDADQPDRIMTNSEVNPTEVAAYQVTPGFAYSTDTEILLAITPGLGASQGSGLVLIETQQ